MCHTEHTPDFLNTCVHFCHIKYISDFKIYLNDGSVEIVDVKGIKTADFKIKEKMFKYRYINLRLSCVTWHNPSKAWLTYEEYNKVKKTKKKK